MRLPIALALTGVAALAAAPAVAMPVDAGGKPQKKRVLPENVASEMRDLRIPGFR